MGGRGQAECVNVTCVFSAPDRGPRLASRLVIRESLVARSKFDSAAALRKTPMPKRLAFTLVLIVTMAAGSWAHETSQKPVPNAHRIHWHKYINKEFGFSLRYPDTYRPVTDAEYCKGDIYYSRLLCLERREDPETTIVVTIVNAGPFFIKTNRGGNEYTRQKIGQNLFYCGLGGSMGVGFSDECTFNLRGKTLEFSFSPAETINSGEKINPVMFKSLKTFRTF
jgi:hypothetical protein